MNFYIDLLNFTLFCVNHRGALFNAFKTKDGRWYHLHWLHVWHYNAANREELRNFYRSFCWKRDVLPIGGPNKLHRISYVHY